MIRQCRYGQTVVRAIQPGPPRSFAWYHLCDVRWLDRGDDRPKAMDGTAPVGCKFDAGEPIFDCSLDTRFLTSEAFSDDELTPEERETKQAGPASTRFRTKRLSVAGPVKGGE